MSERHKAQVRAQFGPSAAAYVTSAGHADGPDLEQLLAWGRKRGAARVLDVATGGGHTALAFSRFTPNVVALDLTLPMLGSILGSNRAHIDHALDQRLTQGITIVWTSQRRIDIAERTHGPHIMRTQRQVMRRGFRRHRQPLRLRGANQFDRGARAHMLKMETRALEVA